MHSTVVTMYSSIHEGASAAQHTDWQALPREQAQCPASTGK